MCVERRDNAHNLYLGDPPLQVQLIFNIEKFQTSKRV